MNTKKIIDPRLTEALEKLEKDFKGEYGQDPTYEEHYTGRSIYSVKITNSKIPIPSYRSSVEGAKVAALKLAIVSMVDE